MNQKEMADKIFLEWKENSEGIAQNFKNRDKKRAKEPMVYFLNRFLQALFVCNGRDATEQEWIEWKDVIKELKHLPVNAAERLRFIEEHPDHYQSFIQLSELFSEWEKKSVILLRRST
ncbi:hypothetical protein AWM68_07505 [Fictibacillus phosphorivorans]|uniref:YpoC-like domain-containing protein n=1 Tax=Fictibacillus phosphorivorans TaxID=1221500 RepID=A0A165NIK5_9BACL|nr:hypothetical protein [Fictibacillus phosphorivorans]KZE66207.1 hypothetical protein AWM68_07505 [Fictibacillus phosphorivorans]